MLWKRTKVMLIACAALTALAVIAAAWPQGGKAATLQLPAVAKDAITKIAVARAGGEYALEKKDDAWRLQPGDYSADTKAIDRALDTLVKLGGGVALSRQSSSYKKFEVEDNALRLTVSTAAGEAWSLLVGKDSADKRGNYVRRFDDSTVYALPARLKSTFDKEAKQWRDRTIVEFDKTAATAISFVGSDPTIRVDLAKTADGWEFAAPPTDLPAGYRLDSTVVDRVVSSLARLSATEFDDEPVSADRGLDPPQQTVTVKLTDATEITVQVGATKDRNVYARRAGNEQIYLLAEYAAKNLRQDLQTLRDLHVAKFTPDQAARIAVTEGARNLTLEKTGDAWTIAASTDEVPSGFVLDPAKAGSFARSLANLQGKTIVGPLASTAAKLGRPSGEITVTLADTTTRKFTFGADAENDEVFVAGDGYVYLVAKGVKARMLKKLDELKVSAARPQQPQFDPSMIDKLPPQMREQFLQEQRKKILQKQIMQQMMKNAGKGQPGAQ